MIEPIDPVERREFDRLEMPPRSQTTNHFRLEEADTRPRRGTMLSLDERNCVIYTRGSVSFFETYVASRPGPLLVRSELTQETQRNHAREILALTKIELEQHYRFRRRRPPVTLRAAQQVREVLRFLRRGDGH